MGNSLNYEYGKEAQNSPAQKAIQLEHCHQDKNEIAGHSCDQSAVYNLHLYKLASGRSFSDPETSITGGIASGELGKGQSRC